ncbi:putative disease resistance protein RGA4 [Vicia villosa]|uniref:putative disease resistance protein RGA4 n=1 Tax=Vicia villosa TaxID=3911 RepID=UPI00273BB80F|nr:putative disease resistance protein RGA4 [Vicia villosa]
MKIRLFLSPPQNLRLRYKRKICPFLITMAESFLFDVANSLLGKVASFACQEASLAYGAKDDLERFRESLLIVRGYLLDAESRKDQSHALREWLRQIQNICFDAEDIFDKFELQDKRKQIVKSSGSITNKVSHLFSTDNSIVFRLRMGHQIKEISQKLFKKAAEGKTYGLTTIPELVVQERELTYPDVNVSRVIGRDNDKDEIFKLLKQPFPQDGNDGDKSMCVIPIVGMGGLGKTTLAKLVFNDDTVDQLFQLKMWVCVSLNFDIKQIIINIINSASTADSKAASAPLPRLAPQENIDSLDIVQLVSRLKQKLSGQKFLLVLDDIWNEDRQKWIELEDLIKVGAPGSKIMVTTRSTSIASMMGNVSSYELKGLSSEECLSLFVKCAFKEGEEKRYLNLVEIAKEIVKKCHGVPLAVKTLGSSLFSNFDINKWEFIRDSEIWNLEQKKDGILPALKASYDQMPSILKQCFVYFSLYPKDYIFNSLVMCDLWVALGLVQSRNGREKLEHVARKYIDELHSRSFIQVVDDFDFFCEFKVHHLIQDLALYVAGDEFVAVNSQTRHIPQQARHLSFVVEDKSFGHALFPESRSVRSIQFPISGMGLESESVLNTWLSKYKYLRYLHLTDSSFETVPKSIAKLEHLRCLDLANNHKIRTLPNSICELLNLQELSFNGCTKLEKLPKGLGKLTSLRILSVTTKQSTLPYYEFASLNNLQTLVFQDCVNLKFLFEQPLPFVEKLYCILCDSLERLPLITFPKLQTLVIDGCQMLNLSLENESSIQKLTMKHLYLSGFPKLLTLPRWIVCAVDTLEIFYIDNFPNLQMLPEYLTTMTRLKRLSIVSCSQLLSLPTSGWDRLTALEYLTIFDCPELYRKCQPHSGEYWPMICHMKNIDIRELKKEEEEEE